MSPLVSLKQIRVNGSELMIIHLDREVLYASTACFVVVLVETASFYMSSLTKTAAFLAPSSFRFGKQLLRCLRHLEDNSDKTLKISFLRFRN